MARQLKWPKSLLLALVVIFFVVSGQSLPEVEGKLKFSEPNSWKSIQSEDGDVIDCVDIYKQPAFQHPLLTNHKIQMMPSNSPKTEITREGESSSKHFVTSQLWQKSGSCPKGTIPIRRLQKKDQLHSPSMKEYGRKKLPRFSLLKHLDDDDDYSYLTSQENQSLAVLRVEASSYSGAQGAIKVCNPFVESDDDYSSSQVALESGSTDYERIESGWAVNPSLYGDRQTRLFTYWTIDSGVYFEILRAKTHYVRITLNNYYHSANSSNISSGCFDLTCSGFVQTNSETALGAALYPISVPGRTPHDIHIRISKDPDTGNWWLIFQEKTSLGYWPADLFTLLKNQARLVFWGGEVNSPNVRDRHPHTATQMGCGYLPPPRTDYENVVDDMSGYVRRIGILKDFDTGFVFPYTIGSYTDEHYCYSFVQFEDGSDENDRPFYYGGHGRSDKCP